MKRLIFALSTVLLMEYACINLNTRVEAADFPPPCPAQLVIRWAEVAPSQSGPWVRVYTGIQLPNAYWVRDVELGVPVTEPKWMMR